MPDVTGQRLDVALSDLDGLGVGEDAVEIVGGGMFGVIDESGWTVCSQRPAALRAAESVRLVVDRTCPDTHAADAGSSDPAPSEDASSTEDGVSTSSDAGADDTRAKSETFRMPQLVGQNLQLAQDKLQARGSYLLDQQDASGLGRLQLLDSNWVVCAQRPAAGKRVAVDRLVTLAAVKIGESCI